MTYLKAVDQIQIYCITVIAVSIFLMQNSAIYTYLIGIKLQR